MITAANAYWLDFFLKRDCNVFVWNYRGYGESEQSLFSPNMTPDQQRMDAERVMQFLVNRLHVAGSIGVYGRSIGGIAASHLAGKFPNLISVFMGDRTLGKLDNMAMNRYGRSPLIMPVYRLGSCFWHVDNGMSLLKNEHAYKIMTFDDQDDVIDTFSSLHHSIAVAHATNKYDEQSWRQFYEALSLFFKAE